MDPTTPTPQAPSNQQSPAPQRDQNNKRVLKGILWIISPILVLIGIAIFSFMSRMLFSASPDGGTNVLRMVFNIISVVGGIAAVVLFPLGLIMGIMTLTKTRR